MPETQPTPPACLPLRCCRHQPCCVICAARPDETTNAGMTEAHDREIERASRVGSLIALARDAKSKAWPPDVIALVSRLADALEAFETQAAELRTCPDIDASWRHYKACHSPQRWPADLLAAVSNLSESNCDCTLTSDEAKPMYEAQEKARATLTRYGLLPAAPVEDARP